MPQSKEYYAKYYARTRERQLARAKKYGQENKLEIVARRAKRRRDGYERPAALPYTATEWVRKHRGYPEPTRPMPLTCENCDGPPNGRSKTLCLDHDHQTGAFRGWLCFHCNTGLGKLGDDEAAVLRVLRYLRRAKN